MRRLFRMAFKIYEFCQSSFSPLAASQVLIEKRGLSLRQISLVIEYFLNTDPEYK